MYFQATAALRVGWQNIFQTVLPYLILEEPSNVEYLIAFLEAYQRQEMEEWGQEFNQAQSTRINEFAESWTHLSCKRNVFSCPEQLNRTHCLSLACLLACSDQTNNQRIHNTIE